MKKLSFILLSIMAVSGIQAVSVTEYIQKNGPITVEEGVVKLNNQGLTSLSGIEAIAGADTVKVLDLADNKLSMITAKQKQL